MNVVSEANMIGDLTPLFKHWYYKRLPPLRHCHVTETAEYHQERLPTPVALKPFTRNRPLEKLFL